MNSYSTPPSSREAWFDQKLEQIYTSAKMSCRCEDLQESLQNAALTVLENSQSCLNENHLAGCFWTRVRYGKLDVARNDEKNKKLIEAILLIPRRSKGRVRKPMSPELECVDTNTENAPICVPLEILNVVRRVIDGAPKKLREIILTNGFNMSITTDGKDMCRVLDIKTSTLRKRIFDARKYLFTEIRKYVELKDGKFISVHESACSPK